MPEEAKSNENQMIFNPSLLSVDKPTEEIREDDAGGKPVEKPVIKEDKEDFKFDLGLLKDNIQDESPDKGGEDNEDKDEALEKKLTDKDLPLKKDDKEIKDAFSVVLGQEWKDGGVLSVFDKDEVQRINDEDGEVAALQYMITQQTEDIAKQIEEKNDQDFQDYKTLVNGGASQEQAVNIVGIEQYVNQLEEIDLTQDDKQTIENRKDLLLMAYRIDTKWTDEKIMKHINKMYDEGSDLEEIDMAKTTINNFVKIEKDNATKKAKADKIANEKAYKAQINSYKSHIEKTEEYFKGDKVNKATKDKMVKALLNPVQLEDGTVTNEIEAKRRENAIEFDAKMAYLFAIGWFDGKPLDKLVKNAETKATSKLTQSIQDRRGNSYKGSMNKSFNQKDDLEKNPLDSAFGF